MVVMFQYKIYLLPGDFFSKLQYFSCNSRDFIKFLKHIKQLILALCFIYALL